MGRGPADPDVMSTGDVAKLLRVSTTTVNTLAFKGLLKCRRIPGGWDRRYEKKDVVEFGRKHGMFDYLEGEEHGIGKVD